MGEEVVSIYSWVRAPRGKLTTAHVWDTGIQQQTKPTLSFQVGLLRAVITWLQEKVESCQSIPNSHFIYQFLEPLSSPQASFSLTYLPSATWICLPGTLHCYSNGWASFPIKSPAFFAFAPLQAQALECFLQNLFTQHKLSIPLDSAVLPSHHWTCKLLVMQHQVPSVFLESWAQQL